MRFAKKDNILDDTSWEFLRPAWWALHTITIGALAYFAKKSLEKQ